MADNMTCPECGADLSDKDPGQLRGHADEHWPVKTPHQHWSEEAWRRRTIVYAMAGHSLVGFHSRGG